jgi:hypothetical protein
MTHVGPEWSQGMTYDDTRHIDVARGEVSALRLTDVLVDLLRGPGYTHTNKIHFIFQKSVLKEPLG